MQLINDHGIQARKQLRNLTTSAHQQRRASTSSRMALARLP
ncbi:hypothetical protein [Mesorhizobium sp. M0622]